MNLTLTDSSIYLDVKSSLPNLARSFNSETISDMAGKQCQEKFLRVGKSYDGSSEYFPGHSRHKWLPEQPHHFCRNKHIMGNKKRKKKVKEGVFWEAKLCALISRHSTRWQGSVLAGHYSSNLSLYSSNFFPVIVFTISNTPFYFKPISAL